MANSNKAEEMLKIIINNQSIFKMEILQKLDGVTQQLTEAKKELGDKIDNVNKNLTGRVDAIGKQLAYLEDDAPTRDEFDHLEKRVDKIEHKPSSIPT